MKTREVNIHSVNNFSSGFCGYESWSLILRGKHRLKMFENKLLRRISGPEREK
jgi:hypothetical protein